MTRRFRRQTGHSTQIDPDQYSPIISPDRMASFRYALDGCAYMLRYQKNARIVLAASAILLPVAIALDIEVQQWAIILLATGGVWVAEFLNGAIEAAINASISEIHPMAKVAKDVAAAAVLIAVLVAALIGILILGPPLFERLHARAVTS